MTYGPDGKAVFAIGGPYSADPTDELDMGLLSSAFSVEPPCYRHTDGDMVPAVVLPDELEEAVTRAVLERAGAKVAIGTSGAPVPGS